MTHNARAALHDMVQSRCFRCRGVLWWRVQRAGWLCHNAFGEWIGWSFKTLHRSVNHSVRHSRVVSRSTLWAPATRCTSHCAVLNNAMLRGTSKDTLLCVKKQRGGRRGLLQDVSAPNLWWSFVAWDTRVPVRRLYCPDRTRGDGRWRRKICRETAG